MTVWLLNMYTRDASGKDTWVLLTVDDAQGWVINDPGRMKIYSGTWAYGHSLGKSPTSSVYLDASGTQVFQLMDFLPAPHNKSAYSSGWGGVGAFLTPPSYLLLRDKAFDWSIV